MKTWKLALSFLNGVLFAALAIAAALFYFYKKEQEQSSLGNMHGEPIELDFTEEEPFEEEAAQPLSQLDLDCQTFDRDAGAL